MDPALLQRFWVVWFRITIADVYPASVSGPNICRREPRWISAYFSLIGSKASALLRRSTHQVQEATVRVVVTMGTNYRIIGKLGNGDRVRRLAVALASS
jgi:hypothetical protein